MLAAVTVSSTERLLPGNKIGAIDRLLRVESTVE